MSRPKDEQPEPPDASALIGVRECCQLLGISADHAYKAAELAPATIRIGRRTTFVKAKLASIIARRAGR